MFINHLKDEVAPPGEKQTVFFLYENKQNRLLKRLANLVTQFDPIVVKK